MKKIISICLAFTLLALGSTANAAVMRTINGIDTQWLEVTATTGMSRTAVEALLSDSTSSLYGYRYATRAETQTLFSSYAGGLPDQLNTFYSYPAAGGQQMLNDFGVTHSENVGLSQMLTEDGVTVDFNMYMSSYFIHGSAGECGDTTVSCVGRIYTAALDNVVQAWDFVAPRGADQYFAYPNLFLDGDANPILGHLLVSVTPNANGEVNFASVPAPAVFWLMLAGLVMMFGAQRRRK